jgi:hypothetical protein
MQSKLAALLATSLFGIAVCSASSAAVCQFSLTQVVIPPSVAMAGTAPWLNLKFEDTATPGTVAVTVSANLTGAQTLTGLWLNIPAVASGAGLTSFTLDVAADGTGEDPFAFAGIDANPTNTQSGIHKLQDLIPSGATRTQVGAYNLQLRFPNSGLTFQGIESETFNLVSNTGSGLTANSFLATSSQTGAQNPNPPFYALASITNADGNSGNPGSGIAYIATAAVPEPEMYVLMLAGLGLAGLLARRRMVM